MATTVIVISPVVRVLVSVRVVVIAAVVVTLEIINSRYINQTYHLKPNLIVYTFIANSFLRGHCRSCIGLQTVEL